MGKDQESSFICYNCNEKNYFDKSKYVGKIEKDNASKGHKEVSIECKSCREMNTVIIEL